MRPWVAREVARWGRQHVGFWPLLDDARDHSGSGAHARPRYASIAPTSWLGWTSTYDASTGFFWAGGASNVRSFLSHSQGRNCFSAPSYSGWLDCGFPVPLDLNRALTLDRQAISISCWFLAHDALASGGLVAQSQGFSMSPQGRWQGWQLHYGSGKVSFRVSSDSQYQVLALEASPPGQGLRWTHVVAVCKKLASGSYVLRLFFDGAPARDASGTGALLSPTSTRGIPFLIGAERSSGSFVPIANDRYDLPNASVSLVRAFARELSPLEVQGLHEREKNAQRSHWGSRSVQNAAAGLTLFLPGHTSTSEDTTLFVQGTANTASLPLTIHGVWPPGNIGLDPPHLTLYTGASDSRNSSLDLFVGVLPDRRLNLVTTGRLPSPARATALYVRGGGPDAGFSAATTLYVRDKGLRKGLPLVVTGVPDGPADSVLNLYTHGHYPEASSSLPLFTPWPEGEEPLELDNAPTFFVRGGGPVKQGKGLNLFLARNEAQMVSLVCQGPGQPLTGSVTFVSAGAIVQEANTTLALPHTVDPRNATVRLYTHGF